jgi:hypothetical protein
MKKRCDRCGSVLHTRDKCGVTTTMLRERFEKLDAGVKSRLRDRARKLAESGRTTLTEDGCLMREIEFYFMDR